MSSKFKVGKLVRKREFLVALVLITFLLVTVTAWHFAVGNLTVAGNPDSQAKATEDAADHGSVDNQITENEFGQGWAAQPGSWTGTPSSPPDNTSSGGTVYNPPTAEEADSNSPPTATGYGAGGTQ